MSVLPLTMLLLLGCPVYAAQQAPKLMTVHPGLLTGILTTSSPHMVAREGSSVLIECNVTGQHGGVQWFNSKGALTGGGRILLRGVMDKTACFQLYCLSVQRQHLQVEFH